jgi:mono/diheme cytochrome c family protein
VHKRRGQMKTALQNAVLIAALTSGPAHGAEVSRLRPPMGGAIGDTLGRALCEAGCASCHGSDGRGAPEHLSLEVPTPNFTDCSFAAREPDADWAAVVHEGGPTRGFAANMPAFGAAFTRQEIQLILDYVRTFCRDPRCGSRERHRQRSQWTCRPTHTAPGCMAIDLSC